MSVLAASPKILSKIEIKPYFQEDNFVLYQGDAILLLSQIPENSIDMMHEINL